MNMKEKTKKNIKEKHKKEDKREKSNLNKIR